ncbi:MAG: alpha-1,2-mannosyltransferase (Kre5), partial [Watsoniomyces obsoletus]
MIEANKTYGFTIAVKELRETVPNIFRYASAYKRLNNLTSQGLWEMFVEPQDEKPATKPQEPDLPEDIMKNDPHANGLPEIDPEDVLPPLTAYYLMRVGRTALLPYHRPGDASIGAAIRRRSRRRATASPPSVTAAKPAGLAMGAAVPVSAKPAPPPASTIALGRI